MVEAFIEWIVWDENFLPFKKGGEIFWRVDDQYYHVRDEVEYLTTDQLFVYWYNEIRSNEKEQEEKRQMS